MGLIEGLEEIIFEEGLRMMGQLSEDTFFSRDLGQQAKTWPLTSQLVASSGGLNDHSEPTLGEICEQPAEQSRSNRFLSNKSLERKQRNLKGIFSGAPEKVD